MFVEEVCPWFPEQGTVNLETWKKVGVKLHDFYTAHGPNKVPADAFPLWQLIRDCLDPAPEGEKMRNIKREEKEIECTPSAPPEPLDEEVKNDKLSVSQGLPPADPYDSELDPADQAKLEEQAARYHHDDPWGIFLNVEQNKFDFSKLKDLITDCITTK